MDDPIVSLSFSFFLVSFVAFLFASSSLLLLVALPSPPSTLARVGEGVEEGRPYGPGLPGFVPMLVLSYMGCRKTRVRA